ncbi:MAG: Na/Pi cotransporter family protein, partial [Clostridia bacterium]|nr:Na/Pi cotransporter family protein [Clostridia bacterium]
QTVQNMTETAFKNLRKSIELFENYSAEGFQKVQRREEKVDRYEDALGAYLVQLNTKELTIEETQTSARYLSSLSNLERISDHAVNLSELAQELSEKGISFSPQAIEELKICAGAVLEILDITQSAVINNDPHRAGMVEPLEEVIDALTDKMKERYIARL